MKRQNLLFFVSIISFSAFSHSPCYFCDTLKPYKHSIMVQFNPTVNEFRDLDYLANYKDYSIQTYYLNLRYGYRVHKNIIVGSDLFYTNTHSSENAQSQFSVNAFKLGVYSRFIANKWQVFKPYADVSVLYEFSQSVYNQENGVNKINSSIFDCYIAPGISFMVWKNHFNIDLGAKFSPFKNNVNGKYLVFTWKLGYNFNAK